jgi:hypothetical protein
MFCHVENSQPIAFATFYLGIIGKLLISRGAPSDLVTFGFRVQKLPNIEQFYH